jgi:hypothetical protein
MSEPNNHISPDKLTKRLLGKILIDGDFITSHDLKKALDIQIQNNNLLGEILVQLGVLDPLDLKIAI